MAFNRTPAQAFEATPRPPIALAKVNSSQVHWVGYDPATKTLVLRFSEDTSGPIYHYAGIEPDGPAEVSHRGLVNAESIGKYFGAFIKSRQFKKYPAEPEAIAP